MKNQLELKYAFIAFILLGFYFLAIEACFWADLLVLKFGNIFIVLFVMNLLFKENNKEHSYNYVENFISIIKSSILSVVFSIIGLFIYLSFYKDPWYFETLPNVLFNAPDIFSFCIVTLIEGVSSSVILSFILMQYYKNVKSHNN